MAETAGRFSPQYAKISAAASGANVILAAKPGYFYLVLNLTVIAASAVNGKFQSASTDLTGLIAFGTAGGYAPGEAEKYGHFRTATNEALNLNLDGAVQCSGWLVYAILPDGYIV